MTVFQHHKVCYVHKVVDGAHTAGTQTLPHPQGGGLYLHILYYCRHIAGAKVCVYYLYIQLIRCIAAYALYRRLLDVKRAVKGGVCLPCKTQYRKTVGAVGCYLEFNGGVVEVYGILYGHTGGKLPAVLALQDEYAVFYGIGEVMEGEPQLPKGAEHTV